MYQPEPSKSSNAPFSTPIKIIALCWMLFMNKIDDSFTGSIYWHFVFLAHEKSHSVVFGRKCLSLCVYCSCHGEIPTPLIKSNTSTLTVCINDSLLNPMQPEVKRNIQAFKAFALCFPNEVMAMPKKTPVHTIVLHSLFGNRRAVLGQSVLNYCWPSAL